MTLARQEPIIVTVRTPQVDGDGDPVLDDYGNQQATTTSITRDGLFAPAGVLTHHYVIAEFAARWRSGDPVAGDDAAEARFVNLAEIDHFDLTADLKRVIRAGAALASCPPRAP